MEKESSNFALRWLRRAAEITLPIALIGDLAGLFLHKILAPALLLTAVDAAILATTTKSHMARAAA